MLKKKRKILWGNGREVGMGEGENGEDGGKLHVYLPKRKAGNCWQTERLTPKRDVVFQKRRAVYSSILGKRDTTSDLRDNND